MDYIRLKLLSPLFADIYDEVQEVSVPPNFSINQFISEAQQKFDLSGQNFALYMRQRERHKFLDPDCTFLESGITLGHTLFLDFRRNHLPLGLTPLGGSETFRLEDEFTGRCFPAEWQPYIIGRSQIDNQDLAEYLAADLRHLSGDDRRISRHHAQIVKNDDHFYLYALKDYNSTYLNKRLITPNTPHLLNDGDRIGIGQITLIFRVL